MDNTRYIQSKTKTSSNRSNLTNWPLRNIYRNTTENGDMLRLGVITAFTVVLIYSTLTSSYAFAAGPDPHDICTKSGSCICTNNPEDLVAMCCQGDKCKICEINTTTGDFEKCRTVIDPSMNTDNPRSDDGVLEQPPTSSPNDNSGFPKGGVAENPQTSPKIPFNKGGVLSQ